MATEQSLEQTALIKWHNCEECGLYELTRSVAQTHAELSGHSLRTETYGDARTELVDVSKHGREGVRMIGRSTRFGNPFKMKKDGGEYTRAGCVEAYREYFTEKIETEPEFREAVESLRGETLGCYCAPEQCHGDVILAYLRGDL